MNEQYIIQYLKRKLPEYAKFGIYQMHHTGEWWVTGDCLINDKQFRALETPPINKQELEALVPKFKMVYERRKNENENNSSTTDFEDKVS